MTVIFTVTFFGGIGEAEIIIFQAGNQIGDPIVFQTSDSESIDLPNAFYIISITGNSAPAGTDFVINTNTNPITPDHFDAGPIEKMYSMNI